MPLGKDVGLGPGDIVLDGEPSLPQKGAQQPPIFGLCNVAKRLPLGTEVDLGPGDNSAHKGALPPILGPCLLWDLWPNGWMDQDATWCGLRRSRPSPH